MEIISDAERQWRRLALAQEKLLVAYRTGSRPTGTVIDAITSAKTALRELGEMK